MAQEITGEYPAHRFLQFVEQAILAKHHALGWALKPLPKSLFDAIVVYHYNESHPNAPRPYHDERYKKYVTTFVEGNQLNLKAAILAWGEGRFPETYLTELVEGKPWSKFPVYGVGFSMIGIGNGNGNGANANGYAYRPQTFGVCGEYQPTRKGAPESNEESASESEGAVTSAPFDIHFKHLTSGTFRHWTQAHIANLNMWAANGRMAEIETILTDATARKGAGTTMFEFSLLQLLLRRKGSSYKYNALIAFSSNVQMRNILTRYGFKRIQYVYMQNNEDRTAALVGAGVADNPGTHWAYVLLHQFHQADASGHLAHLEACKNLVERISFNAHGKKILAACMPSTRVRAWPGCRGGGLRPPTTRATLEDSSGEVEKQSSGGKKGVFVAGGGSKARSKKGVFVAGGGLPLGAI